MGSPELISLALKLDNVLFYYPKLALKWVMSESEEMIQRAGALTLAPGSNPHIGEQPTSPSSSGCSPPNKTKWVMFYCLNLPLLTLSHSTNTENYRKGIDLIFTDGYGGSTPSRGTF